MWQVPTSSGRSGIQASLLEQFAVCDTTSKLSVNKKIILSIIDKIQPSIRRTIIKGTLVWGFSYVHRLGSFFGVQNFESHYLLGFSEKLTFFWGHHKIGLYLGVISMYFKVFS